MRIEGGCHCGAVRFSAELAEPAVELLDCNCSICRMTGHLHLNVADGDFRLLRGSDALTEYRFGTRTARHLFCRHCGIKSFYKPRSHPDHVSINYRCLDEGHELVARITAFDGRNHPGVL